MMLLIAGFGLILNVIVLVVAFKLSTYKLQDLTFRWLLTLRILIPYFVVALALWEIGDYLIYKFKKRFK